MARSQQGKSLARGLDAASRSGFGTGFGGFGGTGSGSSLSYLTEPPSLANVSDANVVVSLKNILKKDSTTKAKALDDLLQYVLANPFEKDGGVDDAILEVWVQLYPRASIDNSRRVRELSHNIQFELMKSARKRMERHVPKVVGAWLAGLYDRDRVVTRAANDGLASFLSTPEKVAAFWRRCQPQILDYAIEAIQETQDTLSDERTTTPEDAEAKYFRVINASMALVLGLLQKVDDSDIEKMRTKYDEYFLDDTVWKTITSKDSSVRKTVCQLFFECLNLKLPYADSTKARQAFITGGLKTEQSGSALEFVRALTKLTQKSPEVWNSGGEKKAPLTRLQAFVAKGSQGSPPKFWESLDQLLMLLPQVNMGLESSSSLLNSVKSGITHREEPRANTSFAWKCYMDTAERLLRQLPPEDQLSFSQEHLFSLIEQFIFSSSERPAQIPLGPNAMSVLVQAHIAMIQASPNVVAASSDEWGRLAGVFCAKLSSSLPEVSKEYVSSQEKTGEDGRRWFALVGHIHDKLSDMSNSSLPDQTVAASSQVIVQCITLLESRNMKPYGAARVLEYALSTASHLFQDEAGIRVSTFLLEAAQERIEKVIETASLRYLISCIQLLGTISSQGKSYTAIWDAWTSAALDRLDGKSQSSTLSSLLAQEKGSELARNNERVQKAIISRTIATVKDDDDAWGLLEASVKYHGLADTVTGNLIQELSSLMNENSKYTENALRALDVIAKNKPEIFTKDESVHTTLIAQLLGLSELHDSQISAKAVAIRSLLDSQNSSKLPAIGIIQDNLEQANSRSLDIETLVMQSTDAYNTGTSVEDLFPSTNAWINELTPFLEQKIDPSVSITNIIGSAATLPPGARSNLGHSARDRKGRSIPARMALYSSQMQENGVDFSKLPQEFQVELLYLQSLTIQLVSDQLTTMNSHVLWLSLALDEAVDEAERLVSSLRSLMTKVISQAEWWVSESASNSSTIIRKLVTLLMDESKSLTPRGAYSSRALGEITQSMLELHGVTANIEEQVLKPEILKVSPQTVLPAAALLTGLGEALRSSKIANNFCNRLVSDIAGASASAEKTSSILALLTLCAQIYDQGELPVANNRIVFAVKQMTSWVEEPEDMEQISPALSAQICQALIHLLPCMKDVYGSYWENSLSFCLSLWKRAESYLLAESLPFIHASLRLVKVLETIQEPNDDLEDAIKDFARQKPSALIQLLHIEREKKSQPLEIVDGMLCREVEKLPVKQIAPIGDIFGLCASESRSIQTAAFDLLHRAIPTQQEQISIDTLLDKTDARLPDELLSLLLDAPTLEMYSDEMLARFPTSIRCYLLSWKLVFDAFSTSSFKTKNDYTENLKADNYIEPLLNFLFDVLGHSAAHPINLDKERLTPQHIIGYDLKLADSESDEKSMQWLLVHLYYLTLKYIPGLFRAWFMNCRSKQTRLAVESWTTKYFSPLIISDALDGVQEWADTQETPATDEQELLVKVSKAAKEVTAGYEVDESQAAIVIKVPPSYPIEGVAVSGLRRVAVTERKWQSWIMTTQGVITFSNGNIIDGLQVFKRNIIGALKGQSECAICYSIISTDKRMPDKKCTTCKNLFHRTCLYKWFQTSNQNTCPLCRNPIDYLGADTKSRRQV